MLAACSAPLPIGAIVQVHGIAKQKKFAVGAAHVGAQPVLAAMAGTVESLLLALTANTTPAQYRRCYSVEPHLDAGSRRAPPGRPSSPQPRTRIPAARRAKRQRRRTRGRRESRQGWRLGSVGTHARLWSGCRSRRPRAGREGLRGGCRCRQSRQAHTVLQLLLPERDAGKRRVAAAVDRFDRRPPPSRIILAFPAVSHARSARGNAPHA